MLDSYQDLIEGLTETPSVLRGLLGNPVPDNLDPATVALLVELRSREVVQVGRVQRVMRDGQTHLRAIEREPDLVTATDVEADQPEASEAIERPETLLSSFNSTRSELISFLMNLTLRDWERSVYHEDSGETSLGDEIDQHLDWDEQMLSRLRGEATDAEGRGARAEGRDH